MKVQIIFTSFCTWTGQVQRGLQVILYPRTQDHKKRTKTHKNQESKYALNGDFLIYSKNLNLILIEIDSGTKILSYDN